MFDFSHDELFWRDSEDSLSHFVSTISRERLDFEKRTARIVAGERYPEVAGLTDGLPPFRDDLGRDIRVFVARSRAIAGISESLRDDLRDFGLWPAADSAIRIFDGASAIESDEIQTASVRGRAAWYGAIFGVPRLRDALYSSLQSTGHRHLCYRFGLEFGSHVLATAGEWTARYQEDVAAEGFRILQRVGAVVDMHAWMSTNSNECGRFTSGKMQRSELFALLHPVASPAPVTTIPAADSAESEEARMARAKTLARAGETGLDESGNVTDVYVHSAWVELEAERANAPPSKSISDVLGKPKLRVIAKLGDGGTGDQKAFAKGFAPLAERGTPLVVAHDVADIAADLAGMWPHAADVVHRIMTDVRDGQAVRMRPIVLVGSPGSGKTSLLNAVTRRLGLPTVVFPCASVSDGSFGGTPAQWHSRRVSTPLQLIRTSGRANPAVILDELEKTGTSPANGSLVHALLPMLERHSAQSYFETALELSVDLSGVVFLATANDLTALSDPLRDRFRVLRMPDATLEHLPALASGMILDIAEERGIPLALLQDLAPDELDVVAKAWGGGSLRKLKAAVAATLELRDRLAVRQ